MKKITLLLIMLMLITGISSAADYTLKKTIGGVSVSTTIPQGKNVILTFSKNTTFGGWVVKTNNVVLEDATAKTIKFSMPGENVEIEAIETVTQTLSVSVNGEVLETSQVPIGESITVTAVEGNGKTFSSWQITGLTGANATSNPLTFTMPNNAVEIIATFIVHTHSWNAATCTIPATCSCGATEGNALGHTWVAATCTVAKTCSVCSAIEGSALGHSYTGIRTCNVNGNTDKVQCANCSSTENQTCAHTYTISKGTVTNGTVTLSATSVKAGGSGTATITPSSGYEISVITVNGSSVTVSNRAGMTYTFRNVTSNQTITATFSKVIEIGAYIKYTPSKTSASVSTSESGYTSPQYFKPSATTSWRVMYNNNGQLDIVSADAVFPTNGSGLYLQGATGYAKAVDTLNNLCNEYVNPTYATSGRSIGCTSNSTGIITTPITWDYTYNQGNTGVPYTDTYYSTDVNQLKNNGLLSSSGYHTWLASRDLNANSDYSVFYVRYMNTDGTVNSKYLLIESVDYYSSYPVRPVVSLKSGIQIVGGSGTAGDPYIIQ